MRGLAGSGLRGRGRWALTIAALLLACSLISCGITSDNSAETTQESTMQTTEFSRLDDAGIQALMASKSVRLDFRNGTIAKSDVGLAEDSYAPDLLAPSGSTFTLEIQGSQGLLTATTDRVRFTTTDTAPDIDLVYYFLTASNLDDYVQLLRDGVRDYGLDEEGTNRWIEGALADPDKKSSFSLGVGNNLGFNVGYDLRYDGTKDVQVIIVTVSATD